MWLARKSYCTENVLRWSNMISWKCEKIIFLKQYLLGCTPCSSIGKCTCFWPLAIIINKRKLALLTIFTITYLKRKKNHLGWFLIPILLMRSQNFILFLINYYRQSQKLWMKCIYWTVFSLIYYLIKIICNFYGGWGWIQPCYTRLLLTMLPDKDLTTTIFVSTHSVVMLFMIGDIN
jgi:hypothetical protein